MYDVLVYVAGPISKGLLDGNIERAHVVGMALMRAGIPVLVPHGTCFWGNKTEDLGSSDDRAVAFLPEILPAGTRHQDWYGMDLVIVSRCDAVMRIPGESTGADFEVAKATELGKPVFYNVEDVINWARTR